MPLSRSISSSIPVAWPRAALLWLPGGERLGLQAAAARRRAAGGGGGAYGAGAGRGGGGAVPGGAQPGRHAGAELREELPAYMRARDGAGKHVHRCIYIAHISYIDVSMWMYIYMLKAGLQGSPDQPAPRPPRPTLTDAFPPLQKSKVPGLSPRPRRRTDAVQSTPVVISKIKNLQGPSLKSQAHLN